MVPTASLNDAPLINEFELGKKTESAYAVGLRLTMMQIFLYQYWTLAKRRNGRSVPRTLYNYLKYSIIR